MKRRFFLCFVFVSLTPVFSQERDGGEFFVSSAAEAALYSRYGAAPGGGLMAGYGGDGAAFGFKALYLQAGNELTTVEATVFLRLYFPGLTELDFAPRGHSGLFLQLGAGPGIFYEWDETKKLPAKKGMFSAGLTVGRRFMFGEYWFAEPFIRAGFPFVAGAGLNAGFRL
jgi:hypothetical protein